MINLKEQIEAVNHAMEEDEKRRSPIANTVNTMLDLVKNADKASDRYIDKLKQDNKDLLQENFDIKEEREHIDDALYDVVSELAELKNICTKKQLSELDFILKRKQEDFSQEINNEIKQERGKEIEA